MRLEFIPPYSPDLTPIEQTFSTLKAWLQRHRALQKTYEDIGGFFQAAIEENADRKLKHYKACLIRTD